MLRRPGDDNGGLYPSEGDNRMIGRQQHYARQPHRQPQRLVRRNVVYDGPGGIQPENYYKIYNNTILYNNRDYTGPNSSW